jgi:hypothetical protein
LGEIARVWQAEKAAAPQPKAMPEQHSQQSRFLG